MTKLCFDIDSIIFEAVSVAEERFITVKHIPTGKMLEFDNRTELWGHHLKKEGGWCGMQNKLSGGTYYKAEDFEVTDDHRLRPFKIKGKDGEPDYFISPLDGAKKILDDKVAAIVNKLGASSYFGYTGTGDVFRHEVAKLLPYKGNREDLLTPILLSEMKQYVCEKHNCTLVTGLEADDYVSMATVAGYKQWMKTKSDDDKVIAVAIDKDAKQTEGWHFNYNNDSVPRLIQGFGSLWKNDKDDVDGCGRMWLYYQIAAGDAADNYKPNCFSDVKFGSKGAYNALVDCKNDKEAFEALVKVFKKLYPTPKVVEGCKGEVEIDWLFVLQEMATLALMLRHKDDKIDVKSVLTKLEINYE